MTAGYVAIHTEFAVEEDFKKLAECGIDIIIIDYDKSNPKTAQNLKWAEKYGLRVFISDNMMLKTEPLTEEKVLEFTEPYRDCLLYTSRCV